MGEAMTPGAASDADAVARTVRLAGPAAALAIVAALVVLAIVGLTLRHGLNGDVAYVLGGFEVRGGGIGAAVDTFVHRPLVYRLALGTLDSGAALVGLRPDNLLAYEAAIRLLADLGIGLVAWALFAGLRTRLGDLQGGAIAVAGAIALVAAPAWDFLQPEWVASALVMAAVAGALAPRGPLVAAALSGALLTAAVGAKLATAPYALIGVALILLLDRRRAAYAAVGGVVCAALAGAALLALPVERQWVADMIALNPNSPMRAGFSMSDVQPLVRALGSKAALSPALLLLPASGILLVASVGGWRARAVMTAVGVLCVVLALATVVVQGAYYLYHFSILPVLAATVAAAAAARWLPRQPLVAVGVAAAIAVAAAGALWMLGHDAAWRTAHLGGNLRVLLGAAVASAALAGGVVAWQAAAARRGLSPLPARAGAAQVAALVAALVATLALAPVLPMRAAWALSPRQTGATNQSWFDGSRGVHETLTLLSERIGRDTPVLYLAYGTVPYHMGNPTDCAYPSPLWLRTATRDYVRELPSFADNAACLASPDAQWLIEQLGWLDPLTLPEELQAEIATTYDCGAAISAGGVRACPRRDAGAAGHAGSRP